MPERLDERIEFRVPGERKRAYKAAAERADMKPAAWCRRALDTTVLAEQIVDHALPGRPTLVTPRRPGKTAELATEAARAAVRGESVITTGRREVEPDPKPSRRTKR